MRRISTTTGPNNLRRIDLWHVKVVDLEARAVRKVDAKVNNFAKAGECMENNLIKVFDSNKANQLADLGFRYT